MRILFLAVLAITAVAAATGPSQAQMYSPKYPVCLRVYDIGGDRTECSFTSIEQCQMSASGRSAECMINPYFAGAQERGDPRGAIYPRANE